jgi:hypothetical protein
VPIQAHFFRKDDGTAWIRWTYYSRRPIDLPVAIEGAEITWAGEFGAVNTVNAAAGDHLRGTVVLAHTPSTIDLACVGSDTHPFSGHL